MGDFEVHKLTIETLGEYLCAVRKECGITEQEAVHGVGIAPKVLAALERADWSSLPEPVYVVGFIRKLAALYEVPHEPLVAQFYRELSIAQQQQTGDGKASWKVLAQRLAPVRWTFGFSVAGVVLFVAVCLWQIFAIGTVPKLVVISPASGQKLATGLVTVSGLATPGSEVALNGQTVYAGADGSFSSNMSLLPGAQSITVSAKSRFNKVATKTVSFVVEQPTQTVPAGPERPSVKPSAASSLVATEQHN